MTTDLTVHSHELAEIRPVGETAVRVTGRTGSAEQDWLLVHKLAARLHTDEAAAYVGAIPTYESVLIEFDAGVTDLAQVASEVCRIIDSLPLDEPLVAAPRHFAVPVLYGSADAEDEFGPDMARVMEITGLSREEIIARHSAPTYVVRCLGAPGGSPMLDGPELPTPVPRLPSPRTSVPQGAVSLAGRQATITPAQAPGGWCVIGRTPHRVLDLSTADLVPYRPGDTLEFEPITREAFEHRAGDLMAPEVGP